MSDLVLAEKDPAVALAEALALYKQQTVSAANPNGTTLAAADPRRLHLQALLLLLSQMRALIDFSGKQSLLRFVSDLFIDELAALWGESRLPAKPSVCTERFLFESSATRTIPGGTRVSDGINIWEVDEDTTDTGTFVDAPVHCVVDGAASNGVAIGQIDTLVDPDEVPGCSGVTNMTATISGRNIEDLESFRARLRDVPESTSTAGPRVAYEALALAASASVADAVALGPDDGGDMANYPHPAPGEVFIRIIKGTRNDAGELISVVPTPDGGLMTAVENALSAETVRPLGDSVSVNAPTFYEFGLVFTYYIARSRSASAAQIQLDVQAAVDAYRLWQTSKIGRDVNPDELISRVKNAGAKRLVITSPSAYVQLKKDESAIITDHIVSYGGVEDD